MRNFSNFISQTKINLFSIYSSCIHILIYDLVSNFFNLKILGPQFCGSWYWSFWFVLQIDFYHESYFESIVCVLTHGVYKFLHEYYISSICLFFDTHVFVTIRFTFNKPIHVQKIAFFISSLSPSKYSLPISFLCLNLSFNIQITSFSI